MEYDAIAFLIQDHSQCHIPSSTNNLLGLGSVRVYRALLVMGMSNCIPRARQCVPRIWIWDVKWRLVGSRVPIAFAPPVLTNKISDDS